MAGKQAISVTLLADNLTWLKGRATAAGESVSELLDQIVSDARGAGRVGTARSVVGTIEIDASDPLLEHADAAVRSIVDASSGRPLIVRERRTKYAPRGKGSRQRRA